EYRPETDTGRSLLAHELTHVVQQTNDTHAHGRDSVGASAKPITTLSDSNHLLQRKTDPTMVEVPTSTDVPGWNDLPDYAQRDLEIRDCNEARFDSHDENGRLTILNLYVKLRGV